MKSTCLIVLAAACASFSSCNSSNPRPVPRSAHAAVGARTIDELLAIVAASTARFQYLVDTTIHVDTGRELADALRAKYVKSGSPQIPLDVFIDRFATRSDGEGAVYYMRQADGTRVLLANWLRTQVAP